MMQIVHSYLEAIGAEPVQEILWNLIGTFRDKVKRRSKSQLHFQFGQLSNATEPGLAIDIVRENYGELFSFGPADPMLRLTGSQFVNRPKVRILRFVPCRMHSSHGETNASRNKRLPFVVSA